jgi:N-acetylglucosamine-6-phosphate deacetylase
VHLEGPWLSGAKAGAQPQQDLQLPDLAALETLLAAGPVAMLTLAPELDGALEVIRAAEKAGVVVSMGHSTATYDQAVLAVAGGARHITHCFNAMLSLHHREPGLVGAALDLPGVTVEAIADGVHLHEAVVRLLWRACGAQRVCLVSDAVDVDLPGVGAAHLADGILAGSRSGLDASVRNVVSWGIPLADALTMASTTPAAVLGLTHDVTVGAPADLVLLDAGLDVVVTVVGGVPVWQR